MKKETVKTDRAPKAIGPYSQGIAVGDCEICYFSGQIPLDPETGKLVEGDIAVQTKRVLKNIDALLSSRGMNAQNVVKTTVFLADIADFAKVNEVYAQYFSVDPPARSCVQVAALPANAKVEIEVVACK